MNTRPRQIKKNFFFVLFCLLSPTINLTSSLIINQNKKCWNILSSIRLRLKRWFRILFVQHFIITVLRQINFCIPPALFLNVTRIKNMLWLSLRWLNVLIDSSTEIKNKQYYHCNKQLIAKCIFDLLSNPVTIVVMDTQVT